MANAYKVSITTLNAVNTNFTVLTASASTTLVKSVSFTHDDHNCSVTMGLTKSGASRVDLLTKTHTADEMTQLNNDVIALEAGDSITVASDHISASDVGYVTVVYVENATSVSGQSIDVLTDVDITTSAPTNGQVLVWNDSANEFQPGDAGGSTATLDDIGNVDTTGKSTNDVLLWNGSNWVDSTRLTELYTLLKSGTSKTLTAEPTNADETEGFVKLEATGATIKVNKTGVEISETSPGTVTFNVATDSSGSTEFDAAVLTGLSTADTAQFIMKHGTQLVCESSNAAQARITYSGTGNAAIALPDATGTLARTADIASDSAVVANTAKTSFPGFGTSAGTALEGDTPLLQLGTTGTTALAGNTTTISTAQANAITANTAKTSFPGFGTSAGTALEGDTNLLQLGTTSTTALAGDTTTITGTQASEITANTAKNTYPSADASKLAGIETGADVTDATNVAAAGALMASSAQLTGNLDVQANEIKTTTSNGNVKLNPDGTGCVEIMGDGTTSGTAGAIQLNCSNNNHGIKIQSPAHSHGATYTLTLPTSDGDANQVLKTDGSGVLSWTNQSTGSGSPTAYDYDAFTTTANTTMNADVSVASNKIVDIMGDALAAKDNANAKKFLGFHTGSGVCVLQGMVDANNSISGASAGSPLWLGASGGFSASAPSTANEYSRIVGYFVGTMQGGQVMCYFNPSQDWVQIDS